MQYIEPQGSISDGGFYVLQAMGQRMGANGTAFPATNDALLVREVFLPIFQQRPLPIVAQQEFRYILTPEIEDKTDVFFVEKHPSGRKYLDTYGVLLAAKLWADEHRFKKPIILSHDQLLPRAAWTARLLFDDIIIPYVRVLPLDQFSSQKKTRTREWFWRYEWKARLVYRIMGYI